MAVLELAAKSALAVILIIAGGAKLSDLPAFAASLRLFFPWRPFFPAMRWAAAAIAASELGLGAASLSLPAVRWLDLAVFALSCSFLVVSGIGYAMFRGRSCQCFGALSQRRFDVLGILRAAALAAIAATGAATTPVQISDLAKILLLCGTGLLATTAFVAVRALEISSLNLKRG
ncbi:MAG: MauE/DoxX family redox-associated membrane protein [Streptosporangiaceae bacterium]